MDSAVDLRRITRIKAVRNVGTAFIPETQTSQPAPDCRPERSRSARFAAVYPTAENTVSSSPRRAAAEAMSGACSDGAPSVVVSVVGNEATCQFPGTRCDGKGSCGDAMEHRAMIPLKQSESADVNSVLTTSCEQEWPRSARVESCAHDSTTAFEPDSCARLKSLRAQLWRRESTTQCR